MKEAMVTGGTGLIGTSLVNSLARKGYRIYFPNHHDLDLTDTTIDLKRIIRSHRIEYVFHCAAKSEGAKTMKEDPKKVITPNVIMTSNLIHASQEAGVEHFIYLSSTTSMHPTSYPGIAQMKWFGEEMCRFFENRYNMSATIIRPTQVYGPGDKFDERGHVIPNLIKRAVNKENPFVIWGTGKNSRDFIYAEDLADSIADLNGKSGTYTIGSENHTTIKEVAEMILDITKYKGEIKFDATKPDAMMINHPRIDIKNDRTSLREGLERTINWYLNETKFSKKGIQERRYDLP